MQDITASDLPGADGLLRRSVLRVLSWVQAGMAHLHYGYLDWIGRMSVPFTAEDEFLQAWAALKNVMLKGPTATVGTATFSGDDGSAITSGTGLSRSDGTTYTTGPSVTFASGTATVTLTADDKGSAGNFDNGTLFTLTTAIAGVTGTSTTSTQTKAGTDTEAEDAFRSRMLAAYRNPPQGGSKTDYVEWALEVPGVTRAWCAPMGLGAGTVVVYTMWDDAESAHAGFPQGSNGGATGEPRNTDATGDQLAVANHIYPLQPVTALVYSYAPANQARTFTIAGLVPNTAGAQASVTAALTGLLYRKASPLADQVIDQSDVDAAISAEPGITSFRVTAPTFPQTSTAGSIFTLGTITWA